MNSIFKEPWQETTTNSVKDVDTDIFGVSTEVTRAEVAEHLSNKKNNKMHPVFSDFKL